MPPSEPVPRSPEELPPGVYVEAAPAGPPPIMGVGTSTTGAVGQTERGPLGAHLVTSWSDYERLYGGLTPPERSFLPWAVRSFFENGGHRCYVSRVVADGLATASVTLGDITVTAVGPGAWARGIRVRIGHGTQEGFRMTVVYWSRASGYSPADSLDFDPLDSAAILRLPVDRRPPAPELVEDYDNLVRDPRSPNHFARIVNNTSDLVRLSGAPAQDPSVQGYAALSAVDEPAGPLAPGAYLGTTPATGLEAFAALDDISLLIVPDRVNPSALDDRAGEVSGELVAQCESRGDRFVILATHQDRAEVQEVLDDRPASTSYAAIYYPWINVVDPRTGEPVTVPPDGAVAGIYARTDETRGVYAAPANEEVLGILTADLPTGVKPLDIAVDMARRAVLNANAVDCLMDFRSSGRGVRVWGARTLSLDPQWKYVNVRRLLMFLEQSIDRGTRWVVFEGNTESTWARVSRSISDFLVSAWRDGALAGTTPGQAFFVRCDRTTMTPDDIVNGRLICLVGVAPAEPGEFVIFRLGQAAPPPAR